MLQVNELDSQPTSENLPDDFGDVDLSNVSAIDDVNIHILQELEDDFWLGLRQVSSNDNRGRWLPKFLAHRANNLNLWQLTVTRQMQYFSNG